MKRMKHLFPILIIIPLLYTACGRCDDSPETAQTTGDANTSAPVVGRLLGYDMTTPGRIATLPKKLKEASDVTVMSPTEVALIQDEKGILFFFDLTQDKVIKKVKFGPKGDYEGMALVGDTMYVLQSNGILFKIDDWTHNAESGHTQLDLPTKDNEGLCYDPVSKHLLVAPKSRWKKNDGGGKHKRPIFAVDITTGKMLTDPAFVIDIRDIISFAQTHHLTLPGRTTHSGKFKENLSFQPAAVAVHPITGDLYVVSATDRVLISFDRQSQITGFHLLDEKLFMQPEGIAFLPDGTLIVVNESPKKKPGLLTFKWQKPTSP